MVGSKDMRSQVKLADDLRYLTVAMGNGQVNGKKENIGTGAIVRSKKLRKIFRYCV